MSKHEPREVPIDAAALIVESSYDDEGLLTCALRVLMPDDGSEEGGVSLGEDIDPRHAVAVNAVVAATKHTLQHLQRSGAEEYTEDEESDEEDEEYGDHRDIDYMGDYDT